MKNILVLGAGLSASSLIRYLLENSTEYNWKVRIVDQNIETAINDYSINNKSLIKVVDVLGRETAIEANKLLLYIYSDGTIEKKYITK